jgi:transposase
LIRGALRGENFLAVEEEFEVERSLPAGHVQAVLGMARTLGLWRLLDRESSRERQLAAALICQRVLAPASKLATSRLLSQSTLGAELGVEDADEDDLYAAMDWLLEHQPRIEDRLARRHLHEGTLVLYDVSCSYFEGRCCPLGQLGYSRDGRRGMAQIIYGLMCAPDGCPVAVQVFAGSLHDDKTLPDQIAKLRGRFGISHVIVVSDRGMVTKANLELLAQADGAAWITALKAPQVQRLARTGVLQLSLFDQHNLAEIASEDYPGERLIVCRNPLVAAERARKREDLLQATERALSDIKARVEAGTLHGAAQIGLAAGAVWNRWKVKKHFQVQITETTLTYQRKHEQITAEAALDGIYVLRTSVGTDTLPTPEVVRSYKQLKEVERAFRTLKGPLELRPIHHHLEERVRAHMFLCMLAYHLAWHLRQALKPLLFDDEHPTPSVDPVAKATRSASAKRKITTKRTTDGNPCHSFTTLLDELATQTRNTIRLASTNSTFDQLTNPNPLQARAHQLINDYTPTP